MDENQKTFAEKHTAAILTGAATISLIALVGISGYYTSKRTMMYDSYLVKQNLAYTKHLEGLLEHVTSKASNS